MPKTPKSSRNTALQAERIKRIEEQIAKPMVRPAGFYATLGLTRAEDIQAFEAKVLQEKNAIVADPNKRQYLGNFLIHDSAIVAASPRPLLILALQTGSPEYVQALLDAGEDPSFLGPMTTGSKSTLMFLLQKPPFAGASLRVLTDPDLIKVKILVLAGVDLSLYSLAAGATPPRCALDFAQACEGPAKNAVVTFITQSMQEKGIPILEKGSDITATLEAQNSVLEENNQNQRDVIAQQDARLAELRRQLGAPSHTAAMLRSSQQLQQQAPALSEGNRAVKRVRLSNRNDQQ
jgi:hypothetical protein